MRSLGRSPGCEQRSDEKKLDPDREREGEDKVREEEDTPLAGLMRSPGRSPG
jgi:hypothetical protein